MGVSKQRGGGGVDQIFTLKQLCEKAGEKKCSVCGFYGHGVEIPWLLVCRRHGSVWQIGGGYSGRI